MRILKKLARLLVNLSSHGFIAGILILAIGATALNIQKELAIKEAELNHLRYQQMLEKLAKMEDEHDRQFACMRLTLFWEGTPYSKEDQLGIADNVLTRVDSPHYPDTICKVVNEIRLKRVKGKPVEVPMYSYIFDGRYFPSEDHPAWKFSGRMTHHALVAYEAGRKPSGSINYHWKKIFPWWAKKGLATCELRSLGLRGSHIHYALNTRAERIACLAAQKNNVLYAFQGKEYKKLPVPTSRPADDVANIILATN